jgi:hypothetical protein
MSNIQIVDASPTYEDACIFSAVWSNVWPQIAKDAGYTTEQIVNRLKHRDIEWWIKAISHMPVAFYAKNDVGNTGIFYLMHDVDFLLIDNKELSENQKDKTNTIPAIYMFCENSTWGTNLTREMTKNYSIKSLEAGYEKSGGWILKSNKRSISTVSKFQKGGYWIKQNDSLSPIWDQEILFEYWTFDNQKYSERFTQNEV